jgi:hypothetical protein
MSFRKAGSPLHPQGLEWGIMKNEGVDHLQMEFKSSSSDIEIALVDLILGAEQ